MTTISLFEHQPLPLSGDDVPLRVVHLRHLERLNQQAGVDLVVENIGDGSPALAR